MTATMREWPIIFSGPMVRAILDGTKTQTRRLPTSMWANVAMHHADGVECRLWVREAIGLPTSPVQSGPVFYQADRHFFMNQSFHIDSQRSSIHMPRWASRITLKVEAIRLEHLNDISEEDADAEGCRSNASGAWGRESLIEDFADVWNSLHTKPGTIWDDNPQVYAVTFAILP